ncbi:glucose 1-dehydrogenase [Virgibacillus halodenitrificans]|uniref:SDR family NAD(P)-dependent oxidoreductase n=1 Tax=Virgibacillus halodenitrificans TaxID=1482 RepID=UPI001FB3D1A3|nr:glucose 1-dehydrogenase [Virgibacillus halodenitrificans]MCJ0930084.1 glucose 1-dehydrogenase [Virgibacillus halodenitrificans]
MGRLDNKVAIVTGAGGGQGKSEALLFAKEGAKVVVTDVQEDKVKEVVEEIKSNGGEAIGFFHDVSSEDGWKETVEKAVSEFGKIDVLVNNAGITIQKPMHETTVAEWDKIMNINLTGTFLGMKHVVPVMQKNGGGSIVNISSTSGLTGGGGASPYTASKGAVRMLSKAAAVDYAKDRIRVNSVHPGIIITPMTEKMFQDEQMSNWAHSVTPLPDLGDPDDVAYGVLYLASDESKFVTGIELPIEGGYTAK